jgi:hypothetical protein
MTKISVPEAYHDGHTTKLAVLKVCYLLAVTAVTFMAPALSTTPPAEWFVIPALLALQAIVLLACRIDLHKIARPVRRLKWLFVLLILMYALLPAETPSDAFLEWRIPAVQWRLSINLSGLVKAVVMCLQIITVLLASTAVRMTGTGRDLVIGLQALRLPTLFVHSLAHTLELLGGVASPRGRVDDLSQGETGAHGQGLRQGQGFGQGHGPPHPSYFTVMRGLLRGDIGSFAQTIQRNIGLAGEQADRKDYRDHSRQLAHDVTVVSGIALCMASFKMLKFLPGLPFASGHKALLLFPLYVLAARLTYSRWGATATGSIMGVIGFLQGDGQFGALEIFKHVGPGVVIDLADPLVCRLPNWAFGYCFLGLLAAVARTATEFAIVLILGARAEVYIFPAARLVPNLLAGFLSGFVTIFLLRAFGMSEQSKDVDHAAPARMNESEGRNDTIQNPGLPAFPAEESDLGQGRNSRQ